MGCPISTKNNKAKAIEYEPDGKTGKKEIQVSFRTNEIISEKKVLEKYDIKQVIGTGTFSNVFRVECKQTKLPFAVKVIGLRTSKDRELFQAEKSVLSTVSHKYIVKFHEIIQASFHAYIVMELATGGDLLEKIQILGKINEKETIRITRMLIDAVNYLHENNITHRDLKPENILFYTPGEESRIILTDFGFASHRSAKMLSTYCGTLQYLSPEIISEEKYTNKVDIWSLGVVLYFMLGGYLPFVSNDVGRLGHMITSEPHTYNREIWKTVSEESKKFIDNALIKNPEHRMDSQTAKNHPWLKICDKVESADVYKKSVTKANTIASAVRSQNASVLIKSDEGCTLRNRKLKNNFITEYVKSDDAENSLVIDFDFKTNFISKTDILAQSFRSSDTQSNKASELNNSHISETKCKQPTHQSDVIFERSESTDQKFYKSPCNRLPPINQKLKPGRKLSYQGDLFLFRTFQELWQIGDNNGHVCNPELFHATRRNAWIENDNSSFNNIHRSESPERSRCKNLITATKISKPLNSKYRRSRSADSNLPYSI